MSIRKYYYLFYFYMMAKIDMYQVFTKTYCSQLSQPKRFALEFASVGSDSAQILPSGEGMLEEKAYTTVIFGLQRVRRRTQGVARVYWLHALAVYSTQSSFV